MENQEIISLLEGMEDEKRKMLTELSQWPAEKLTMAPANGWHALQVLEHVIGSEIGTLGYLKKKTLAPAATLESSSADELMAGEKLIAALQSRKQWKAPDVLPQPRGLDSLGMYAAKWEALRFDYATFISDLSDEYLDRLVFRHPLAGMLNLAQTIAFLRDHITHHMFQLERIKVSFT